MMFTSLDYLTDIPPQSFELKQFERYRQQVLDEPVVEVAQNRQQRWVVNSLPDGFMLTQSTMRYSQPLAAADNHSSENQLPENMLSKTAPPDLLHMVYSDGLASVSVFIEKNQGAKKHLLGVASMGALNAFGRSMDDYFVTVVGEVPVKTVELIAQSTARLP